MFISFIILLILIYTAIKTFSFSIWCFRDKNIIGGISVMFLLLCVMASGVVLLE